MTKRMLSVVAVAAVLTAFTSLSVTTSAAEMNCRIPFSFIVNGKTLPPGPYSIATNDAVLMVKGLRTGAVVLTNGAGSRAETGRAQLVFLKTGDRYDLFEIWTADGVGRAVVVPRKHLEDRARAANTPIQRIAITGM
jgi:hypothetical protein